VVPLLASAAAVGEVAVGTAAEEMVVVAAAAAVVVAVAKMGEVTATLVASLLLPVKVPPTCGRGRRGAGFGFGVIRRRPPPTDGFGVTRRLLAGGCPAAAGVVVLATTVAIGEEVESIAVTLTLGFLTCGNLRAVPGDVCCGCSVRVLVVGLVVTAAAVATVAARIVVPTGASVVVTVAPTRVGLGDPPGLLSVKPA
jgi:hypothetical protein